MVKTNHKVWRPNHELLQKLSKISESRAQKTRLESKVFSLERLYTSSPLEVFMGQKKFWAHGKFWIYKLLGPRKLCVNKILSRKNSFGSDVFKKISGSNKIDGPKILGLKKNLGSEKMVV